MTKRSQNAFVPVVSMLVAVVVLLVSTLASVRSERDAAVKRAHQFDQLQRQRMEACAVAYDDAETVQDSARADIACGGDEIVEDEKVINDDAPKFMKYCTPGGCAKVPMTKRIDENGAVYYTVP